MGQSILNYDLISLDKEFSPCLVYHKLRELLHGVLFKTYNGLELVISLNCRSTYRKIDSCG